MMSASPEKEWWTTTEIAASGLPDVPETQKGVEMLAKRQDWRAHPEHARRRAGRGGGWEYNWRLLPVRAQSALLKPIATAAAAPARMERGEAWAWFEGLPKAVQDKAKARLLTIQKVERLEGPMGRHLAVVTVAQDAKIAERTLWGWLGLIEGVDLADRIPYLAPRHRAANTKPKPSQCSQEFFDWLRADYLRLGEPSFQSCYDRVVAACKNRGLTYLEPRTARRWIDANIQLVTRIYARQGERGLSKCFPPQIRDRSGLVALEGVNADCHKIDVFVQWPGIDKPVRPQIVAFQDLYSGMFLAWRVDLDPNKVAVMSAFGDLIDTWGIPRHCLFDNGHEFANKWISGGTPTRFRFKVNPDDPLGVLPQLGIQIHWATPAHGQAKPIERGFRDFADRIAKHPAFAGAYVGNKPNAKPEDYGSRSIPLDEFLTVVTQGIKDHNSRPGRLSANAKGRSFEETFAESYATAPIRKATAEQRRLWLMGQEVRRLHATHGTLTLHHNGYWSPWMNEFAGQKVVARFNPEDLHEGLFIYSLAGEFLGEAECRHPVGFFDLVGARLHARQKSQRKKAERKLLKEQRPVSVKEYLAALSEVERPELPPIIEAKVVRPIFGRTEPMPQQDVMPREDAGIDAAHAKLIAFEAAKQAKADLAIAPEDTSPRGLFRKALEYELALERDEPLTPDQYAWLIGYQNHSDYRAERMLWESHGDALFG